MARSDRYREWVTLRSIASGDRTMPLDEAAVAHLEAAGLARLIARRWELTRPGRAIVDTITE